MTTKEAVSKLNSEIRTAKPDKLEDISIILALGAGHLSLLTESAGEGPEFFLDRVSELMAYELSDAIVLNRTNNRDGTFVPIYCGDWESVLASLIIDEDWKLIHETAEGLLKDGDLKERKPMFPKSGFWQLERVAAKL